MKATEQYSPVVLFIMANVNLYHVTSFPLNCRLLLITSTQKEVVSRQFYP